MGKLSGEIAFNRESHYAPLLNRYKVVRVNSISADIYLVSFIRKIIKHTRRTHRSRLKGCMSKMYAMFSVNVCFARFHNYFPHEQSIAKNHKTHEGESMNNSYTSDRKDMIHDLMRLLFSVIASMMNILCEERDEKIILGIVTVS
jgi:hypothetical protein